MKGLLCYIFKNNCLGDSSCNGISSNCERVILVGENVPKIFESTQDIPTVKLVNNNGFEPSLRQA